MGKGSGRYHTRQQCSDDEMNRRWEAAFGPKEKTDGSNRDNMGVKSPASSGHRDTGDDNGGGSDDVYRRPVA